MCDSELFRYFFSRIISISLFFAVVQLFASSARAQSPPKVILVTGGTLGLDRGGTPTTSYSYDNTTGQAFMEPPVIEIDFYRDVRCYYCDSQRNRRSYMFGN
jgi:hypothetical protein